MTKLRFSKQYGTGPKTDTEFMKQTRTSTNKSTLIYHLIYDKRGKSIQWGKTASSKMVFEKLKGYMQKNKTPQKCTLCNYVKNKKKVYNSLKSYVNSSLNFF